MPNRFVENNKLQPTIIELHSTDSRRRMPRTGRYRRTTDNVSSERKNSTSEPEKTADRG